MSRRTHLELSGARDLKRLFNELPKRVIKKGLRKAMTAAATPITKNARRRAAKESGTLNKAITKKIKSYPGGNVVALIGANRATTGEHAGKLRRPANYLHLVERGHGGPHPAPAYPFLAPAYEAGKAQAIKTAEAKLAEVLVAEAQKLKGGAR